MNNYEFTITISWGSVIIGIVIGAFITAFGICVAVIRDN